jgi:hypothetical protein
LECWRQVLFHSRVVCVVIYNFDLLSGPANQSTAPPVFKLQVHVECFEFNDETDVLVGICDGRIKAWYAPMIPFVDKDLLPLTVVNVDGTECGRNAQIVSYSGCRISIRKVDGSIIFASTPVDIDLLYELARAGRWDECLRICRHQKSDPLWGTLACLALAKKQLDTVETCLAELNEVPKVCSDLYIC